MQDLRDFWWRYKRNRAAIIGLVIIFIVVFLSIFGSYLAPYDPMKVGYDTLLPPGDKYVMGTDDLGRDVFSSFLYGARISLFIGIMSSITTIIIGVIIGASGGYYEGKIDVILRGITEFFQVIPRFFLMLTLVALFGAKIFNIILVISILSWPRTARITRAEFLSLKEQGFVEGAKALGESNMNIIFSEILPNALPPIIVNASLEVAHAVLLEAGMSFFGLGDPSVVSWGLMLNRSLLYIRIAWWMSIFPGMAIFLTVLGFNVVGDGLNDSLNPRLKERSVK